MASAIGLLLGVGIGLMAADQSWSGIAAAVMYGGVVIVVARRTVPRGPRADVPLLTVVLAYSFHVALATLLHAGAKVAAREGFITGDDAEYFFLSRAFASWLHGQPLPPYVPPWWNADSYLFGTFVYLEGGLFYVFGPDPHLMLLLNGAAHVVTALLLYDMARRVFGDRSAMIALVAVLIFPSLVLWSSLNLKDALSLLLLTTVFWLLQRFQARPRVTPILVAFVLLILMESLRRYLFVGILLLMPLGVGVARGMTLTRRLAWTAGVALVSSTMLAANQSVSLGPNLMATFETTRQGMALNANTAYVQRPIRVNEGLRLVVATHSPGEGFFPSPPPTVRNVGAQARIVVVSGPTPAAPEPNTVYVQPGDILVIGPPGTTPGPETRVLALGDRPVQLTEDTADTGIVLARTLAYLPTGMAHALFAPFPWSVRRTLDWLAVPDVLVWYMAFVLGAIGAWQERRRLAEYVGPMVFVIGLLGLLSLAEGNVGTVFRHRSMVVPFVVMLAAPAVLRLLASRGTPERVTQAVPRTAPRGVRGS